MSLKSWEMLFGFNMFYGDGIDNHHLTKMTELPSPPF